MAQSPEPGRKAIAVLYGIICHGLFAAGVGMMMYQMYFGMSGSFGSLAPPWSVIANLLLVAQFPLAHSLLLTRRGQGLLAKLAPPGLGRNLLPTIYVAIAALQTLLLFYLWSPSGVIWWQARGLAQVGLGVLYLASWLLLAKAIWDAGLGLQTGAIGWLAVYRNRPVKYPPMPRRGLFRLCRQPIYLAFAATLWTVSTWTPDQLFLAISLTAYCLIGPLFKEARFARLFAGEFPAYQKAHRYFLPLPLRSAPRNDLSIYDRHAAQWWDGSVRWLRTLQNLVPARLAHFDTITMWPGKSVLDLGCGGGFMSEALAARGAIVTGIDPASAAIAIAAQHAKVSGRTIRYLTGSGEAIPLADASMDIVVCVDVLEHVTELDAVLAGIARVLKPGGLFLYDTINRNALARFAIINLAEDILRLLPRGTHDPDKFIRPAEISDRLRRLGLSTGPVVGLGPKGINRHFDFTFGVMPVNLIMYMSHARKT